MRYFSTFAKTKSDFMPKSYDVASLQMTAINKFNSGFNCAQSVLGIFANDLGIDDNTAMSITSGFGAGMGRLQKTCGAVTGAFMVLSYFSSQKNNENSDAKEEAIIKIREFNARFLQKNNTTDCQTLLNCDLNSKQGQEEYQIKNLRESVCEKCIRDSILITSELLTQR